MATRYEYKFVRLDETTPVGPFGMIAAPVYQQPAVYQQAIQEHAAEGWRLVQLLVPAFGATYYELILEREIPS